MLLYPLERVITNLVAEIKDLKDSDSVVILNIKTLKNVINSLKIVKEKRVCDSIIDIIICYIIPNLDYHGIKDTHDIYTRLHECRNTCETDCERHLYTHMLNTKFYSLSNTINVIKNKYYENKEVEEHKIKLALIKIDYIFIHVMFYFIVLGHDIIINKNFSDSDADLDSDLSMSPVFFYFHCSINQKNQSGYRLFDDLSG